MADSSDVSNTIAGMIASTVYPNGTSSPSISGSVVKIYPGWPVPNVLQEDINASGAHISIWALPSERKIGSELGRPFRVIEKGDPPMIATVDGLNIMLSGSVSVPTNVYFLIDGTGYHYPVQSGDTLATVATAMANQIPGATSSGAVITLASGGSVVARTGGIGTAMRELRRQAKDFQITIWAPTPAMRVLIASAVDAMLSENSNISLGDGAPSMLFYTRQFDTDASENYLIYRRDLIYTVNYATTQTIAAPQIVAPVMHVTDASGNPIKTILE
ncbi:hypothetical protein VH86_04040 [Pantoea sp. BL1]|uniref:hypothetical protein n=1 Tax=Pantoea sp. BL1 TaxID=1628190 RepID=UPI0005F7E088|nr:hypothetical protein [Pantoea sp. BL1]KJV49662.1 hypothetical protein VH86_04040 [Pantoea sp. BL1]